MDEKVQSESEVGCKDFFEQSRSEMDKNDIDEKLSYIKFAIEIEDQGIGIPQENLNDIFIDFMKVSEHNDINPDGTGLGLSICKMIVEKMRGKIDVKSQVGVGTTFSIIVGAKVALKSEPKFVNRFKFHKSDENDGRKNQTKESEGMFLQLPGADSAIQQIRSNPIFEILKKTKNTK